MRSAIGSFLISAAIVASACGTQSPASPSAAVLHGGDSHQGGRDHGGSNSGSNGGSNSGSNNGSNHGGDDGGAPTTSHESEFTGLVTAVGTNSITVAGQKIMIDSNTRITGGDDKTLTVADIKTGNRVEVKATVSGTTVTATRIQVEDAEDHEPGDDNPAKPNPGAVEVNGTIVTMSAGCPVVTLTVGTTKITTSTTTMFEDTTCAALSVGDRVEVKGTLQSNGTVAATSVERE